MRRIVQATLRRHERLAVLPAASRLYRLTRRFTELYEALTERA